MTLVNLGTGIGGAMVLDGRLYRGHSGMAGEFGHQQMVPEGRPCECGHRGCYVQTEGRCFWSPAEAGVVCVDTTGAGDSFVGGFLSCLAQDLPLEACLAFANRCGARAVEHVGATAWIT